MNTSRLRSSSQRALALVFATLVLTLGTASCSSNSAGGGLGAPCTSNLVCASGLCLSDAAGSAFCSQPCTDACPSGYECVEFGEDRVCARGEGAASDAGAPSDAGLPSDASGGVDGSNDVSQPDGGNPGSRPGCGTEEACCEQVCPGGICTPAGIGDACCPSNDSCEDPRGSELRCDPTVFACVRAVLDDRCGNPFTPCCTDGAEACFEGFPGLNYACVEGRCLPGSDECGDFGQVCCPGGGCLEPFDCSGSNTFGCFGPLGECGEVGLPCCEGASSGGVGFCDGDSVCDPTGRCAAATSCGDDGEPCCDAFGGPRCVERSAVCLESGVCQVCGETDTPCCEGPNPCRADGGVSCIDGFCVGEAEK